MTQTQKLSKYNTQVIHTGMDTIVIFHNTPVITIKRYCPHDKYITTESIILDTGGWFTTTTKTRMNQASNQWKLGYHVYQDKGEWYVRYRGYRIPFKGNTVELGGDW